VMDRFVDPFYVVRKSDHPVPIAGIGFKLYWQVLAAPKQFGVNDLSVHVFNGEFDSGSERTLAAWIRHASRTGFPLVAIPREV
jgi:hypothetical protein